MHGMEHDSSFLNSFSLGSFLPAWLLFSQSPKESKLITDLRTSKSELEDKLQLAWRVRYIKFPITRNATSFEFLQYCYYHKSQRNIFKYRHSQMSHFHPGCAFYYKFQKYKEAQIDDYSALGAAIISIGTSNKERRNFIQEFIKRDFKPTPKDIGLAELALYDEITKHKPLLHVLYSQADWSVLPEEIRKQIVQYMIQLFKKEFWLLPETSLNDC